MVHEIDRGKGSTILAGKPQVKITFGDLGADVLTIRI
jgi:hypothetical protein